jgi:F0F1-type ATP synthase alpha subunit
MDVTLPDKFLANIRKYEDRNFAKFDEEQQNIMTKRIDRNIKLVSLLKQKGFEIISNSNLYYLFRN